MRCPRCGNNFQATRQGTAPVPLPASEPAPEASSAVRRQASHRHPLRGASSGADPTPGLPPCTRKGMCRQLPPRLSSRTGRPSPEEAAVPMPGGSPSPAAVASPLERAEPAAPAGLETEPAKSPPNPPRPKRPLPPPSLDLSTDLGLSIPPALPRTPPALQRSIPTPEPPVGSSPTGPFDSLAERSSGKHDRCGGPRDLRKVPRGVT